MTEGTLCGALIYASDESRPMTATLGGVLDIQGFDGKWHRYGMTAGHLLNQRTVRAQIQAPSLPLDDSEDGQSEPEDYPCTDVNEYDLEIVWQAQEAVDTPTKQTDSLSALGTAFVDTELASFRDLDFALIEFDSDDTAKPNVLVNWQLDDQEEPAKELRMNDIHPLAGVFTRRSVLVLWNGDNIKGTLSRDATSLLAGLSWSFVETFTLVLDEGRGMHFISRHHLQQSDLNTSLPSRHLWRMGGGRRKRHRIWPRRRC